MKFDDSVLGKRFGRWLVLARATNAPSGRVRLLCRCDCGAERVIQKATLGRSSSCGCLKIDRLRQEGVAKTGRARKHGQAGAGWVSSGRDERSPTYNTWSGMLGRCRCASNKAYPMYGGRGIHVYERWLSFENFLADMGEKPPGTSLDRIDPNGHYEPDNCRWATALEQAQTKRLSSRRVAVILEALRAESVDLLERAVIERVRVALLGA